jgi:DNA-binding CsgD family transcriptional regulator
MTDENNDSNGSDDNSPELSITHKVLRDDLKEIMADLTRQERDVLCLRFGLKDGKQRTLKEVQLILGVSQDKVLQIEMLAFRKLRMPHKGRSSSRASKAKLSNATKKNWRELVYPDLPQPPIAATVQSLTNEPASSEELH